MAVNLSPVGGAAAQFFDNNGVILSGGKLYTYQAGTTTPAATYTTIVGNVAHTNPIVLDSAGRVPSNEIWLTETTQYKFILHTSLNVPIASYDNISGIFAAGGVPAPVPVIFNTTGTGSATTFALGSTPTNENTTNVYINGVYQQKNTYSLSGANLVFSQAPPITSSIEVSYV
jgi:hypothetical protein